MFDLIGWLLRSNFIALHFSRKLKGRSERFPFMPSLKTKSAFLFCVVLSAIGLFLSLQGQTNIFPATGGVGIGTTNPETILDVRGSVNFGGPDLFLGKNDGRNQGQNLKNRALVHGNWGSTVDCLFINHDGDFEGGVIISGPQVIANGNMGIATAGAPIARLQIGNPGGSVVTGWSTTRKQGLLIGYDSDNVYFGLQDDGRNKQRGTIIFGDDLDDYFTIQRNDIAGICQELIRIEYGGNVGIGTTSPTHKLTVNGPIRAKEIIVDTGWADYVFADDYQLPPLSEVEAHIKEHKHLPGIPSSATVTAEGISLGEMQTALLAKIEELTLHLIEQDRRISEQFQITIDQTEKLKSQAERIDRLETENVRLKQAAQ